MAETLKWTTTCACLHTKEQHLDGVGKCQGDTDRLPGVPCPCQWYYKLVRPLVFDWFRQCGPHVKS